MALYRSIEIIMWIKQINDNNDNLRNRIFSHSGRAIKSRILNSIFQCGTEWQIPKDCLRTAHSCEQLLYYLKQLCQVVTWRILATTRGIASDDLGTPWQYWIIIGHTRGKSFILVTPSIDEGVTGADNAATFTLWAGWRVLTKRPHLTQWYDAGCVNIG